MRALVFEFQAELSRPCRDDETIGGSWRMDETYGALSNARFRRVQVPPALE